ncbi:MAG: DUF2283 domain-containing protein [Actinomycetota bacterium]|nr:DUF2283 domain-containing protein [Actinomycetota bacterium]
MPLRATYDPDVQALTLDLRDGVIAGTIAFPDSDHLADVDADGNALSLEILSIANLRLAEIAARFGLEGQLQEIAAAIAAALPVQTAAAAGPELLVVDGTVTGGAAVASSKSGSSGSPAREVDLVTP